MAACSSSSATRCSTRTTTLTSPGEAKPALKLNQYGGDVGGPIRKGKTFFFGYWQGTRQRKDETVTIGTVLTAAENPTTTSDGSAQFPAGTIVDPQTGMPVRNRRTHSREPD